MMDDMPSDFSSDTGVSEKGASDGERKSGEGVRDEDEVMSEEAKTATDEAMSEEGGLGSGGVASSNQLADDMSDAKKPVPVKEDDNSEKSGGDSAVIPKLSLRARLHAKSKTIKPQASKVVKSEEQLKQEFSEHPELKMTTINREARKVHDKLMNLIKYSEHKRETAPTTTCLKNLKNDKELFFIWGRA